MKHALLVSLCSALMLMAQSGRDAYRTAYAEWRQADPNIERDAGPAPEGFAARADRLEQAASRYNVVHGAFLRASAEEGRKALAPFAALPAIELEPKSELKTFVTAESKSIDANIKVFEKDKSRAIAQVRYALERERSALADLGAAIDQRAAAAAKADAAGSAAEQAKLAVISEYSQLNKAIVDAAALVDQETAAWTTYYQKLAMIAVAPVKTSSGGGAPPLPLIRYVGTWSFPAVNGVFSGPKPEFVDVAVHEDNGQITGSFYARFTLPPGVKVDPVLRFDFSGPLASARTQRFALQTAEGAKGIVDLIPGGAINLLEVNFHTDARPGKVQLGDMVLLKK